MTPSIAPINVCISADDNYAKYAGVVMAGALLNAAKNDALHFYILDGGISGVNREKILSLRSIRECEINFVKIDPALFDAYKSLKTHAHVSLATYYRLKLASLLPGVSKIIYLDCDVAVNSSLRGMFGFDMGGCVAAGVLDIDRRRVRRSPSYVNAGVLLLDLDKMRALNIEDEFLNCAKNDFDSIKLGDQDIINAVLKGRVALLPKEWNVQSSNFTNRSSYARNPKIVHYVSRQKPWVRLSWNHYKDLYFKALAATPWGFDENEKLSLTRRGKLLSMFAYFKYRPLFLLRPRFYKALYETYIKRTPRAPFANSNTFFVWEPCSRSHAEVVPGFAKHLLDLGYDVTAIVHPDRLKEGLFSRLSDPNLKLAGMTRSAAQKWFSENGLGEARGIMVTTAGKIVKDFDYEGAKKIFGAKDDQEVLFVEHEARHAVDAGRWSSGLITLRRLDYEGAQSVVVNPHCFGKTESREKNAITNFVTVGALAGADKKGKKNTRLILDAVRALHEKGVRNFKITVIGKGSAQVGKDIEGYFNFAGRLDFADMYSEIERADFFLTAYEKDKPAHLRYITTGTSGNFQLVYGFNRPCLIVKEFAPINGFDEGNSVIYAENSDYASAMERAINMTQGEYGAMRASLKNYSDALAEESRANLEKLIRESD